MSEITAYLADEHEAKVYTAWELGADWWWTQGYFAATKRALYSQVNIGAQEGVCLWRLVGITDQGIKTVRRYVDPDMPMRLVRFDHASDDYIKSLSGVMA